MKNKRAIIENTCYSLLLYFLYDKDWKDKDYFIFGNRISQNYLQKLSTKVSYFDKLESFSYSYKKNTFKFFLEKIKEYKKLNSYSDFYGNVKDKIYIPFKAVNRFEIEDGLGSYVDLQTTECLKKIISDILNLRRSFLKRNKVEKYLMTMSAELPERYLKDVIEINIHERWHNLKIDEQKEILDIFCINVDYLNSLRNKKVVILTQCFSEDGFISEDEKIEIYRSIIENYDENDIMIKPHPREETKYSTFFPNVSVVDEPFPFELISLHGIHFEKAITLTSSSVFSFNYDLDVDYFGTEGFPKLIEKTRLIQPHFVRSTNK